MAKQKKQPSLASKSMYIPGFGRLNAGDEITAKAKAAIATWKAICNPPKKKNDNPTKSSDKQKA